MVIEDFKQAPRRVVSLVPSMTESLFDLGMGASVVGITRFCVHPAEAVQDIPRVGGTKDPDLDLILDLEPDLVLANQEENTPGVVRALRNRGVRVWLTFPKNVAELFEVLRQLAGLFQSQVAFLQLDELERAVELAAAAATEAPPWRYFCPVWYEESSDFGPWWMTFNDQTYPNDVLRLFGGTNVFGQRERRHPLAADLTQAGSSENDGGDRRYPRIGLVELQEAAPEVILLPDEPFAFKEEHVAALYRLLPDVPAAVNRRILLLDGSLITWHGTRLAQALRLLPSLLNN